jgi:methylated-DNA-[protein]-cysteine S-methyltransferase
MAIEIKWVENCTGVEKVSGLITPAGLLTLFMRHDVLIRAEWENRNDSNLDEPQGHVKRYLLNTNEHVPTKILKQGTPYRQKVWAELCKIPFGETMTYSELAKKIDSSARAVGNACRDNPYPFIVPCHRIVSVSGLGGYYGQTQGNLMAIKAKLLHFEATHK